jgi:rhodanese-related sulfurtransferase
MKEVTVQELKAMLDSGEDIQLVDVREPQEYQEANIKGKLIPLANVPQNVNRFATDKKVIIHCRSGKRSGDAITYLETNFGHRNLYNLKGGILAWKNEIDNSLNVS